MIRLYVGNLPHHASEQDVMNWFREAGVLVENTRIMRDLGSGTSKGCGFVDVGSREQAIQAIRACNGAKWLGRILVVKGARPPVRRRVRVDPDRRHNILRPPLRAVIPSPEWVAAVNAEPAAHVVSSADAERAGLARVAAGGDQRQGAA
jgi:RNA recognition motif-containing protein